MDVFSWILLKLKPNTLIWNCDKCTFLRTTKINYSWNIKGRNKEIQNAPFIESMYMILVILSNGWWRWLITNHTINSLIFINFIQVMKHWINFHEYFEYRELVFVMDNCPSHKIKAIISEFHSLNMNISFLLTYSPNLAPIEICSAYLKYKIASSWKLRKLNLEGKESQNCIFETLNLLTKEKVKKYFSKFLQRN